MFRSYLCVKFSFSVLFFTFSCWEISLRGRQIKIQKLPFACVAWEYPFMWCLAIKNETWVSPGRLKHGASWVLIDPVPVAVFIDWTVQCPSPPNVAHFLLHCLYACERWGSKFNWWKSESNKVIVFPRYLHWTVHLQDICVQQSVYQKISKVFIPFEEEHITQC